jgi:hypothetical protein
MRSSRGRRAERQVAYRAGNDLHRSRAVVTPGSNFYLVHAAAPGGKKGGVPREQPFGGKRLVIVARRVEHHFDDAFDVAVSRLECTDVHPQAARYRGPHLFCVKLLALNLTAFDDVGRKLLQHCFLAKIEAQSSHVADQ